MLRKVLHSKIHMARVTGASVDYMGSITVDSELLDAAGLRASDAVSVANARSGARFETYIFRGERGSRTIEVNGAAALLVERGDPLILMHFAWMSDEEYRAFRPTVLLMNADNSVRQITHYEPG